MKDDKDTTPNHQMVFRAGAPATTVERCPQKLRNSVVDKLQQIAIQ